MPFTLTDDQEKALREFCKSSAQFLGWSENEIELATRINLENTPRDFDQEEKLLVIEISQDKQKLDNLWVDYRKAFEKPPNYEVERIGNQITALVQTIKNKTRTLGELTIQKHEST